MLDRFGWLGVSYDAYRQGNLHAGHSAIGNITAAQRNRGSTVVVSVRPSSISLLLSQDKPLQACCSFRRGTYDLIH